ncbi:MAG: hypothetical protein ACJAVO_001296 [Parvibaculaceae bacterium]|jgi:hypothetical protein
MQHPPVQLFSDFGTSIPKAGECPAYAAEDGVFYIARQWLCENKYITSKYCYYEVFGSNPHE